MLNADILSRIIKLCWDDFDYPTQRNIRLVARYFSRCLITNLYDNVTDNLDIIPLLHPKIIKLKMGRLSQWNINNEQLRSLTNLTELQLGYCPSIKNIDYLSKLKKLTLLDIHYIGSVNNLTRLVKLKLGRYCLNNSTNLTNLTNLDINHNNYIRNGDISKLTKLTKLNAYNCERLSNINNLTNLTKLNAGYRCAISNKGITKLTNLTELDVTNNHRISKINHLVLLKNLYASEDSGITNYGINKLYNLEKLYSIGNNKVTRSDRLKFLTVYEGETWLFAKSYHLNIINLINLLNNLNLVICRCHKTSKYVIRPGNIRLLFVILFKLRNKLFNDRCFLCNNINEISTIILCADC